ncbi:helix-turn-helix domain-containing protein [Brevibacterium sp. XM4083]|uniref:helix-turn-helix domain-containing protein n=1 Tax=Brevibacterium sp. XM4083 TaxID=2583238 RepID=UPI0015E82583|nr:helix-turn-helix domain-containing protein [Brevibacterium sp. XM4083]MCM1013993.1 helix-turn-helix domain-containing protein [Brevibacterium sp. XM4083]
MIASAGDPPVRARFSTDAAPPARRVEDWEAYHAAALVGLRTVSAGGAAFRAVTSTLDLPQVRIAKVTGTPHSVRRGPAEIAGHPASGALVYLPLRGASTFAHRGGQLTLGPGRGIVVDGDTAFARSLGAGVDELVVRLPRPTLTDLTGGSSWPTPTVLDLDDSASPTAPGRAFAEVAEGLIDRGLGGGAPLEGRLLDLLGSVLGAAAPGGGIVEEALTVIADHHREPDLSAARIAGHLGVSERQLTRILAEAGLSVPRAVLGARLDTAAGLLADPHAAGLSMAEVAASSGFRSAAQFSRTYRDRFGIPPLRHRRQLSAELPGS